VAIKNGLNVNKTTKLIVIAWVNWPKSRSWKSINKNILLKI